MAFAEALWISKVAPIAISPIGVAIFPILVTVFAGIPENGSPQADHKSPATMPMIIGFVIIPFSVFFNTALSILLCPGLKKDNTIFALFALGGRYVSDECEFWYEYDSENALVKITVERGRVENLVLYLPDGVKLYNNGSECGNSLTGLDCGTHEYQLEIKYNPEIRVKRKVYFWSDYLLTEKTYKDESTLVAER